jgi:O-antigen/teichoic acid export membrane protein
MADQPNSALQLLSEVPKEQRDRIITGIRSTVWLAALSTPFSYGTTILLARTSAEAVGTYGLLAAYVAFVSCILYLGGDAVAMKFMPEVEKGMRPSFLISYYAIICVALIPWFVIGAIWPDKLHYIFGTRSSPSLQLFILYLAPLSILFSLIVASLKGLLEIAPAQGLARLQSVGYFFAYLPIFLFARSYAAVHYTTIIWGIYFTLTLVVCLMGLRILMSYLKTPGPRGAIRYFLPSGFWKYTFSLQQLSALNFFSQRLDVLLVLNFGNLALLGKYVAIITLADSIRIVNRYIIDTLLPSLTNVLAVKNYAGATDVFAMHMRILLLINAAGTFAFMFLARPLLHIYGVQYLPLANLVVILAILLGVSGPCRVGGILLSSVGKQQRAVWISLGQLVLYVTLFSLLWPRWQLAGGVWAYGLSMFLQGPILMIVAWKSVPFRLGMLKSYLMFCVVSLISVVVLYFSGPLPLAFGLLAWAIAIALFLIAAGYRLAECRSLLKCFLPVS